jgi:hypothetical protein
MWPGAAWRRCAISRAKAVRPSVWSEGLTGQLQATLAHRPGGLGQLAMNWTVPLLKVALSVRPPLSAATLRRRLLTLGYIWKRFRYGLAHDPEREKKRKIRRQIRALPAQAALLAQDERDLLLFPRLRAGWAPRGQPEPVPISGHNARRTVFGALHLRTGHALFLDLCTFRIAKIGQILLFPLKALVFSHPTALPQV